jgi:hypothetical protein
MPGQRRRRRRLDHNMAQLGNAELSHDLAQESGCLEVHFVVSADLNTSRSEVVSSAFE